VQQKNRLTPREAECLRWCSRGKTNWEISRILSLSERTVEHYLSRANRKLGTANRTQAVAHALREKLI
jgi:LuxR family transcriptional regulator, quorum-sensing system regulator BjaR1